MRVVRCQFEGRIYYGVLENGAITLLRGTPYSDLQRTSESVPLPSVTLLAPCEPSKIVAAGINYALHAPEIHIDIPAEPLLFIKPSTSVIGPGQPIILPAMSSQVEYEGELAVVIGKPTKYICEEDALDAVFGYTCINDVTARDLQRKDVQFTRSKSFDTFAPLGPWIETELDPSNLLLKTYVNDNQRQSSSTSALIRNVQTLISFVSQIMTLLPGDVIATGTPAGVGLLSPGDTVSVVIEGIGTLTNPVESHVLL